MSELKNATLKAEMAECLPAIDAAHKDMSDQTAKVASAAAVSKTAAHDLEAASEALSAAHKKLRTAIDAANTAIGKAT
jgi:hypothetical protein